MILPEQLYQLSARDHQVTWLDPILTRVDLAAALATVSLTMFTVPIDRALLLFTAVLRATAGAAQTCSVLIIDTAPPNATLGSRIRVEEFAAPAQREAINFSGGVIVPPTWIITGTGGFNAGAAANTLESSVQGILIPAGNIQRV